MAAPSDKTAEYERLLEESKTARYVLRLFVSGTTPRPIQAIESVRALCEEHLAGRFRGWSERDPTEAMQAAQMMDIPLLRDMAMRFVTSITGDASLVSQIKTPYDQVMALTALGEHNEAAALAVELKETYPLLPLAKALARVAPQTALALVDEMLREADKAEAMRTIGVATRDPAIFKRALDMALAARVRNDALAPAQASLSLANAFASIDPALAQQALEQAHEIAQRISTK